MKTIIKILVPLLLVAFVVLKLCKVISWSWWWVLSPAWGVVALLILAIIIALFVAVYQGRKATEKGL